jgi:hypothetical protein
MVLIKRKYSSSFVFHVKFLICYYAFHFIGLAIAADKTMYIADGTNIRAVDSKGIIHTLVGHHGHHNHWTPVPCHGAIPAQQVLPLDPYYNFLISFWRF